MIATAKTPATSLRLMLVGASGAVGQALLAQALAHPRVAEVVALTRRPLPPAPNLHNVVVDFAHLPQQAPWWQVDALLCTLGTTRRVAGSDEKFVAIDRDLALHIAGLARQAGATRLALNSSLGADAASGNLYLRTKGEAEQAVSALGFASLTIVRPSLIDTKRRERRTGEQIGLALSHLLRPLVPRQWRPVSPQAIAAALLAGAVRGDQGVRIVESGQLGDEGGTP